ncbi:MAG: hypothetical protein AB8G11_22415 [Saprospiraceae bacterium]
MANYKIKRIGKIGDVGNVINIPIVAEEDGLYSIKTSNSKRTSGFSCHAQKGNNLYVPNVNGQKRLFEGLNKIIVYKPNGQRLIQVENGVSYGTFLLELYEVKKAEDIKECILVYSKDKTKIFCLKINNDESLDTVDVSEQYQHLISN